MSILDCSEVQKSINDCINVAHSLFNRNKVSGSSANLSFRYQDYVVITSSGSSFGTLDVDDFSVVSLDGILLAGRKASKEAPLHLSFYKKDPNIGAVLHTHSFYSTIWSCLNHSDSKDIIPKYTPYLEMKLGKVGLIPFAPPGSKELFALAEEHINDANGFLLANHGPIVPGKNIYDAFYILEELEESCKIAWYFRQEKDIVRIK